MHDVLVPSKYRGHDTFPAKSGYPVNTCGMSHHLVFGVYVLSENRSISKQVGHRLVHGRESRGGRPGLPVLMSLMVSVDVKQH